MQSLNPVRRSPTTRTMWDVDDLRVQKRLWGRDGHGVPGANPNYAGRVGLIAAAVVLVLAGGAFALLTGGPAHSKTATRYITDVAKDVSIQPELDSSLHDRPAESLTIVHNLVQTLLTEDRRLSTQHWPTFVNSQIRSLVAANQQQITILNKYAAASSSERVVLLKRQNNNAYTAQYWDARIRTALGAGASPIDN
jgi:hypothetical protein